MPLIKIVEAIIATVKSWSARPARTSYSLRLMPDGAPGAGAFGSVMDVFLGEMARPLFRRRGRGDAAVGTTAEEARVVGKGCRASEWLHYIYTIVPYKFNDKREF